MGKIDYRQMPAPRDLPQNIFGTQAKVRMQKPQTGVKFSVQIPEAVRWGGGGELWQNLIAALTTLISNFCGV